MGLRLTPLTEWTVPLSFVISLLPLTWLPTRLGRPSLVVYYMLYLLVVVPSCVVPSYTGQLQWAQLFTLQLSILTGFGLVGCAYSMPLIGLQGAGLSGPAFCKVIAGVSLLCYGTIIYFAGLPSSLPSIFDVYGVREAFKSLGGPFALGYAMDWQSNVVNPYLIAAGLVYRKRLFIILGVVGQLFIYAESGGKGVLFSALFCFGLYWILRRSRGFIITLSWGMAWFVGLCVLVDQVSHSTILTALFVRREIFLPGLLTSQYFDFFSENPHALLGHSVLKGFVNYPYALDPTYLIGDVYFGHSNMSANANLWADGYANFGYVGILVVSMLLACWLWLVDSMAQTRNRTLVALMVGIPSLVLSNTGLLTAIANHGLALTLLLVYLLPKEKQEWASPANRTIPCSASPRVGPGWPCVKRTMR